MVVHAMHGGDSAKLAFIISSQNLTSYSLALCKYVCMRMPLGLCIHGQGQIQIFVKVSK